MIQQLKLMPDLNEISTPLLRSLATSSFSSFVKQIVFMTNLPHFPRIPAPSPQFHNSITQKLKNSKKTLSFQFSVLSFQFAKNTHFSAIFCWKSAIFAAKNAIMSTKSRCLKRKLDWRNNPEGNWKCLNNYKK